MSRFFDELKRRRVYQSAAIYAVAAWGLAQVVDFIAERLFLPDWIPTLTAIVFIVGFPVAIFLAWTFDIGSSGIRRTGAASIRGVTSLSIAVVMLVGGTALIYSVVWPSRGAPDVKMDEAPLNSIAVLPFSTFGDASNDEYLSDGIADEILYALSSLKDLRVAARTSSFSFKGKDMGIEEVSEALNVRHVVEGNIRIVGSQLNVRVSLIQADSGFSLWSESYDRRAADVLDVQEDIASNIADAIHAEMGMKSSPVRPRFRAQTTESEAYRLYLQGRFLWHQRGAENIQSAIAFFEQAIDLDSEFAAAWAGMASAYLTSRTYGARIEDNYEKGRAAAMRAIELDDSLGEPYGALSQVAINADNFAEAERLLKRGIALTPKNSSLRLWLGTLMINVGRVDEASKLVSLVINDDPTYPVLRANFGFSSFARGNYDIAEENFDRAWQLGLRARYVWRAIMWLHFARDDYDAAEEWMASRPDNRRPTTHAAQVRFYESWISALRAPSAQNRELLTGLLETMVEERQINANVAAYAFGTIDDPEHALELLLSRAKSGDNVDQGPLWLPGMRSLRAHERFPELVDVLGLLPYWREQTWADQCRPSGASGVQCFR